MFLLILVAYRDAPELLLHLHSNMFLLIPLLDYFGVPVNPKFTFQYVSINTTEAYIIIGLDSRFTFQYVSINTLIDNNTCQRGNKFTFQYVSINTSLCGSF